MYKIDFSNEQCVAFLDNVEFMNCIAWLGLHKGNTRFMYGVPSSGMDN